MVPGYGYETVDWEGAGIAALGLNRNVEQKLSKAFRGETFDGVTRIRHLSKLYNAVVYRRD